jgi:hypothetical protein
MLTAGLLQFSGGRIRNTVADDPEAFNGGTPMNAAGVLLCVSDASPDLYVNGIAYRESLRVAVHIGGTVDHFSQSIPFTSTGRVVCDTAGAITHHVAGIPRTATGALALAASE